MNDSAPVFSIVIPVYNTNDELRNCVESLITQSYANYEVILVDDGSKDGSGELCDVLARENEHVLCIHKENGGAADARNVGIKAAKGRFILFVDSDDMWDYTDALKEIAEIIENTNADLVCFGTAIYGEDGSLEKERKPVLPEKCGPNKEDVLRHLVYTNQYFSAAYVKVTARKLFEENDLYFRKGLKSGEDIEWSAKAMVCCKNIAVYPRAFYKRVRRAEGSITSDIGKKNVLDVLFTIETGVEFARDHAENETMLDLYFEYWTYQYAMLFGLAQKMKGDADFDDTVVRLKKLKWLLKYDHVKKVKAVKLAVSVLGVSGTMKLMDKYYSMK